MKELTTTTNLVKHVLETVPETRDSDNLLYLEVIKVISAEKGVNLLGLPMEQFFKQLTSHTIPSIETVGRCRRKLQEKYPELRANEIVIGYRSAREEMFEEYARG